MVEKLAMKIKSFLKSYVQRKVISQHYLHIFFVNQAWLQQWTFPEQRENLAPGFGYMYENNEEIQC